MGTKPLAKVMMTTLTAISQSGSVRVATKGQNLIVYLRFKIVSTFHFIAHFQPYISVKFQRTVLGFNQEMSILLCVSAWGYVHDKNVLLPSFVAVSCNILQLLYIASFKYHPFYVLSHLYTTLSLPHSGTMAIS